MTKGLSLCQLSLASAGEGTHGVPGGEHAGLLGLKDVALLVGEVPLVNHDLVDVLVEPRVADGVKSVAAVVLAPAVLYFLELGRAVRAQAHAL